MSSIFLFLKSTLGTFIHFRVTNFCRKDLILNKIVTLKWQKIRLEKITSFDSGVASTSIFTRISPPASESAMLIIFP